MWSATESKTRVLDNSRGQSHPPCSYCPLTVDETRAFAVRSVAMEPANWSHSSTALMRRQNERSLSAEAAKYRPPPCVQRSNLAESRWVALHDASIINSALATSGAASERHRGFSRAAKLHGDSRTARPSGSLRLKTASALAARRAADISHRRGRRALRWRTRRQRRCFRWNTALRCA